MTEEEVLEALRAGPVSGGRLIERMQIEGGGGRKLALVYAALENLRARRRAAVLSEGEGERVYGLPGTPPPPPRPPGNPPSFALDPRCARRIEDSVARMTRGLRPHFAEELRRAVVAAAERRIFHGAKPARAVEDALASIGPERAVRRLLRRCERGGPVPLRMRGRAPRLPFAFTAAVAAVVLVRLFLVGVYAIEWNSMEPALAPKSEGGDALVLVNLRAFSASPPARGDIVVFDAPDGDALYVKRAMGLPGESVSLGGGDLFVGGARLVKERALLDRVRVPLFRDGDFRRDGNRREQPEPLHAGLPDASGRVERGAPCVEAVVRARVRATAQPCTIALHLDEGLPGGRATRSLVLRTTGPGAGAFSAGAEVASGPEFLLRPGVWREAWLTNADRVFRVELDGREVARAALPVYGPSARLVVEVEGEGEVEALEVARDALYGQPDAAPGRAWELAADEVFVLGDNSAKSRDSRHFGPVRLAALRGRPFLVVWPPSRVRALQ